MICKHCGKEITACSGKWYHTIEIIGNKYESPELLKHDVVHATDEGGGK